MNSVFNMDGTDTQLGQIYIHNRKLSKSFILVESGKVPETGAELYTIVEVAAEHEKVAKLLSASLKKSYRRENPDAFENAVAQANDQLASMAAEGNAGWVGKVNALLAAKQGDTLSVATCGKIHAYLYRGRQLSDLSDSPKKQNPLKTIENFAVGKVQCGDFLIFSTSELFNYVSAERVQALIETLPLAAACEAIAALIRENADEKASFGTMILEIGNAAEFRQDTGAGVGAAGAGAAANVLAGAKSITSRASAAWSSITAQTAKIRNVKMPNVASVRAQAKGYADLQKLRALPRAKKFFLAAAAACVVLLAVNVAVAIHAANVKRTQDKVNQQLSGIEGELNGANSAYMYGDQATAVNLLNQAKVDLSKVGLTAADSAKLNQLNKEAGDMDNAIAHIHTADAQQVVSYSGASIDTFVVAHGTAYMVNKAGGLFVPYNFAAGNGKAASGFTLSVPPITNVAAVNGVIVFTDKNGALYQLTAGATSAVKQVAQLPANSRGLAFYGSPTRVYTVDQASNRIVSTTFASSKAPVSYLKSTVNLSGALDLTVDGSVYVLSTNGIQKYTSGTNRPFGSPSLTLRDPAKIYTQAGLNSLFILDTQNNGIVEVDKITGKVLNQYRPGNVKNIQAFAVDDSNPASLTIYALDNQALYKITR